MSLQLLELRLLGSLGNINRSQRDFRAQKVTKPVGPVTSMDAGTHGQSAASAELFSHTLGIQPTPLLLLYPTHFAARCMRVLSTVHIETDVLANLRSEDPSPLNPGGNQLIERSFISTVSAWHIIDVRKKKKKKKALASGQSFSS